MPRRKVDQDLFRELREELGLSIPAIYARIQKKKGELDFAYNENIAALVIARQYGIDVYPYLASEETKRDYREAMKKQPTELKTITRTVQKTPPKVTFPDKVEIECPNLPRSVLLDAIRMAEVYSYFYVFENSVRHLIIDILETKYGSAWWDEKISIGVKRNANSRIEQEDKQKWHGKRGKHPIFYTDLSDLSSIISVNWTEFKDKLPNQEWINQRIGELELSRNTIAHNNLLEKDDFDRVKMYFKDWIKQIS